MAKSLRSKWRRKCRAVKRAKNASRELATLKKTLGIDDDNNPAEINMTDLSEIAKVTDAQTIREEKEAKLAQNDTEDSVEMDEDGKRIYNKKTMKDQYGNYPVWMPHRKIVKFKKGRGRNVKATAKHTVKTAKRLTRKDKKRLKKREAKEKSLS